MKPIRSLVERFSRNVILKRRLPESFGGTPIYVTPGASLRYWRRDISKVDPLLLRFAQRYVKPGHVVWDIGANVGLFSLAAASRAGPSGRVVSVEPDAGVANLLLRSVAVPNDARAPVQVLCAAVGQHLGIGELHIAKRSRSSSFTVGQGSTTTGGVSEIRSVITITLDWLLCHFPPPHVLKIDVEGAEVEVLRGAEQVLTQECPVILCEVFRPNVEVVTSLLKEAGLSSV